jgi:hypothetical protein
LIDIGALYRRQPLDIDLRPRGKLFQREAVILARAHKLSCNVHTRTAAKRGPAVSDGGCSWKSFELS